MKKIKIIILGIIVALICIGNKCAFAIEEENTWLAIEGEENIAPGANATATVKIKSNEKIGIVSGKIEFGSDITLLENGIEELNGWMIQYNEEEGKFVAVKAKGSEEEEIFKINYTASTEETISNINISEINMVDINYNELNLEEVSKQITIKKVINEIRITNAPTKTSYIEGENFNKEGMIVKVYYNDGTVKTITDYTIIDGANLASGKTSVIISYTEGDVTKTITQAISVQARLTIRINDYTEIKENNINYIENIKPGKTIKQVLESIDTNGSAKVYKGTTRITDENIKIATGMIIKITLGDQNVDYTVVVTGDINGDGQLGNVDLLKLVRYSAGLDKNLEGAYLRATDIYKDGKIADNKDILKCARILAGLDNI